MDIKMNIGEALVDAVMGWAVVFLGIALLILVVLLVGKIMSSKKSAPAPAPAPAVSAAPSAPPAVREKGPAAPGVAGELKLYDTPERDAAMVMAIVADELKIPINELRFISIREVKEK